MNSLIFCEHFSCFFLCEARMTEMDEYEEKNNFQTETALLDRLSLLRLRLLRNHHLPLVRWFKDILNLSALAESANQSNAVCKVIFEGCLLHSEYLDATPDFGTVAVCKAVELLQNPRVEQGTRKTMLFFCRRMKDYSWADSLLNLIARGHLLEQIGHASG